MILSNNDVTIVKEPEEGRNSKGEAKKKALIISVSKYIDNKLPPLEFCKNDGEKMYETLKSLGYEIADNHNLIGYVKYDAMREAVYDFFDNKKAAAEDTLLFYYSGHGIPTSNGNTVLASSEIDHDAPNRRGFSSYELTTLIQDSVSIRIVEILDCCYSGAAKVGKGFEEFGKGGEDAAATLGMVAVENNARMLQQQGEGKCLLAASQAAQEAYGLKEKGHSIFTYYLVEGLNPNKKSIDLNGNVTPYSLGNYVYKEIMNLPQNKRPKQKPIVKAESVGDIILAYYPELVARAPQPQPYTPQEPSVDISLIIDEGLQYIENENYENAIKSFDKAIAANPTNHVAYNHKGDILFKLGKYNEAIDSFNNSIAANPTNHVAYNHKGDILFKLGKYNEAVECYNKALAIYPKYFDVLKDKGLALIKLGKHDEAIECFDEALKIDPKNNEILKFKKLVSSITNYSFVKEWKFNCKHCRFAADNSSNLVGLYLFGITVDSSGNVYVPVTERIKYNYFRKKYEFYKREKEENYSYIYKINNNGESILNFGGADDSSERQSQIIPLGVAVDSSGNVYVAEGDNNRIQKFTSDGTFITKWDSKGSENGQFNFPYDIAVDSSGNVYVSDSGNYRIQKFTSDGTFITKWGSTGSENGQFNSPKDIAVDSSGNVYIVDDFNYRIQKFDSDGNFITKWGNEGVGDGQFNSPDGIAVDSSGNVYVGDNRNYRIQKFTSDGTFITKWGSEGRGEGQFLRLTGIAVDPSDNVYVVDSQNDRIQKFIKLLP